MTAETAPTTTPSRRAGWFAPALAGLLAMLALMGLQEALNGFNQAFISAPSAAAQTIVRLTPGAVTTTMIETLGPLAIRLLTGGAYVGTAVIGLVLGLVAHRLGQIGQARLAIAVLIGAPFLLYLLVAPAQLRDQGDLPGLIIVGLVLALLYAGLTLLLWRGFQPGAPGQTQATPPADGGRRAMLAGGLAGVALLAGGGTWLSQVLRSQAAAVPEALAPLPTVAPAPAATAPPAAAPPPATPPTAASVPATAVPVTATPSVSPEEQEDKYFTAIRGIQPEVTPTERFYVVDEAIDDPRVDVRQWRLTIRGHVEKPLTFTYDQVRAMPAIDQHATLMCISYELGQDLISNGRWRGVSLAELLKQAGVKPGATHVVLRSVDRYDETFPLAKATEPTTILAYGMNDALLPVNHGAPLRAVVPGLYGFKNVKWLTDIEVVTRQHDGYWWRKAGWSRDGFLLGAMSRIDTVDAPPVRVNGEAKIAGIAYAGPNGISKVEVSDDGGATWAPARVKRVLSPLSWRLWAFEWRPKKAGKAQLLVRAYQGDGTPQIAEPRPSHPNGSTGLHGFDFDVVP